MNMQEVTRLIMGLREDGWDEKKINNFMIYIESGNKEYSPKNFKETDKTNEKE